MIVFISSRMQIKVKVPNYFIGFSISDFILGYLRMPKWISHRVFELLELETQQLLVNLHRLLLHMFQREELPKQVVVVAVLVQIVFILIVLEVPIFHLRVFNLMIFLRNFGVHVFDFILSLLDDLCG